MLRDGCSWLDAMEQRTHIGYRWWSREELRATGETFYPVELPGLMPDRETSGTDQRDA
ncbi:hypothetical protein GCM10009839_03970 [Catenulispora yoronensis]|uniref:Uncharacterized protein n=1 Tax=Catenulispora yoronensis TaxID=450799 RepID=A0ABN2TLR7_9ACTN